MPYSCDKVNWSNLEKGFNRYIEISELYQKSENIKNDHVFQRKYKGFYKVRKNESFCKVYFEIMQRAKNGKQITIKEVLQELYEINQRVEISFASKLLATLDTSLPVWDSIVISKLKNDYGFVLGTGGEKLKLMEEGYKVLIKWYDNFLKTVEAEQMIVDFDNHFPGSNISKIKKIDFILWQTRDKK